MVSSQQQRESKQLLARIQHLAPTIAKVVEVSGAPGLSLGVLHLGNVIHTEHFGRHDISKPGRPNDDTIYRIASLSKAFTAAAIAALVYDRKIEWNTRISDILTAFKARSDNVGQHATVVDLLAHRTG